MRRREASSFAEAVVAFFDGFSGEFDQPLLEPMVMPEMKWRCIMR